MFFVFEVVEVFEARNSIPDPRLKFQGLPFFAQNPIWGSTFPDSSVQRPKCKKTYQRIIFEQIHSNFNSRGVTSRELVGFVGHNSSPYHAILTKIGGMKAISVPDLSITSKSTNKLKKLTFPFCTFHCFGTQIV